MPADEQIRTLDQVTEVRILDPQPLLRVNARRVRVRPPTVALYCVAAWPLPLCVAHSSSGPGRRPLKAEITGSNPVCATTHSEEIQP